MKVLVTTKKWQDKKNGPIYDVNELWIGDDDRAKQVIDAGYGKEATNAEIKTELDKLGIDYDSKANKDELTELLKGE